VKVGTCAYSLFDIRRFDPVESRDTYYREALRVWYILIVDR